MMQDRRDPAVRLMWMSVCLATGAFAIGAEPAGGPEPAIEKGVKYLRARVAEGLPEIMDTARVKNETLHGGQTYNEIVLYTLLTAGVPADDPDVVRLVEAIRAKPLAHTYGTAIRAQAFEKLDPLLFRADIAQCGQFLVDNQGKKGAWSYSQTVPLPPLPKVTLTPNARTMTASGSKGGPAIAADRQTKALPKTVLQRRGWGEERDNSNTQYAMLGLAACAIAGIHPPPDVYALCEQWLTECQNSDGGWGYRSGEKEHSYGSMTAGAVSSLSISLRARHQDPAKDLRVRKGLDWLGQNLTFDTHPGGDKKWLFYWIYSVERAGAFSGADKFGDKAWYALGTAWLLANQQDDGSWEADKQNKKADTICDTCWAILFLKQASKHYVYTG